MSELTIYTYLKSVKRDNKPVMMRLSFGHKETDAMTGKDKYIPLPYNTEIKVKNEEWDKDRSLPKDRSKMGLLLDLEEVIKNTYKHLIIRKISITPSLLKEELDKVLGRETKDTGVVYITDYIKERIEVDTRRKKDTQGQFTTLRGKIEEFEKSKNIKLSTSNLTRKYYLAFMEEIKKQMGKQNSVWKIQKNLNAVLNEIRLNYSGLVVFNPKKELGVKEKTKQVEEKKVFFNFDQISLIIEHKSESEKLENVRLILLTLLFTGCRYSDVFKIKPDHEYIDDKISFEYAHFITTKKPQTEVIVPILKPLAEAFKKNNGQTARPISDQKFNKYVKDLCEEIGMNEEIQIPYNDANGNKKFETKLFYKFVTSHIGRRSFISNLIEAIPITLLTKVTGHKFSDKEVIFRYNKTSLLKSVTRFVKTVKKISNDEDFKDDFPIPLV